MMSSSGAGRYMAFPPSPSQSVAHLSGLRSPASTAIAEHDKYLSELLGERQKISPFMAVLPHCYRLLNQG
ncbi:KH domain-containing protein at5g56140-like protein [Trifolium pratense]|uniref:KH domain-containing protein at5g56140-like protein n=1 Tax=Trifolium pratense TaxID=57577 RepID=A0A2K3PJR9_TRIPR|nr:KH domain-containing protein at5g56140-like protein [Trifolium pratense]